jgi:uncharacterized protein YbjT (DUF2867 family)
MVVAVTGANGHVGANLVRELLRRGRRVRVVIHRNDQALAGLDVERVRGDVADPRSRGAPHARARGLKPKTTQKKNN